MGRSRLMLVCASCGETWACEDFAHEAVPGVAKMLSALCGVLEPTTRVRAELMQGHGCPVGTGVRFAWENLDRPDPGAEPVRPSRPPPAPPSKEPPRERPINCRCLPLPPLSQAAHDAGLRRCRP